MKLPIVVIGDTQRTLLLERLMGREQNDAERAQILAVAANERPGAFIFLGDLVGWGASEAQWAVFDDFAKGIVRSGTAVRAIFGNHDYLGGRRASERNLLRRFSDPGISKWWSEDANGLRVLFLDSNRHVLSGPEWTKQSTWFRAELARADEDLSVKGVMVVLHHPPYSNSRIPGGARWVESDFVPPFLASGKTLAMVSGHVHAYEKFAVDGRYFFVAGGGGGPRVRLLEGDRRLHVDLYSGPSPRPFHYLRVEARPDGIDLVAIGFAKGDRSPKEFDRTTLKYR
ncbi:MAG: metallophosphoesterase [Bdellovibrionales bacterium]|nr:metallophosphoesterase [Bdellovibrionales bacterium]